MTSTARPVDRRAREEAKEREKRRRCFFENTRHEATIDAEETVIAAAMERRGAARKAYAAATLTFLGYDG